MIIKISFIIFENIKIFFLNMRGPIYGASFQVKLQNAAFRWMKNRSILHNHNIEIVKIISFNFENPINSCNQWLVLCVLNMRLVFIHYLLKLLNFTFKDSFDEELRIIWKKEKTATSASAFSSIEYLITVIA